MNKKCPFDNKPLECTQVEQLGKNFSLLDLLDAEKNVKVKADERLCDTHIGKKIKFYCRTHSTFVCSECLLAEHIGHDIVPARPLILGVVVAKDIDSAKLSVVMLKSQAEEHLKLMEDTYVKDSEAIEIAYKKLIEEIHQ